MLGAKILIADDEHEITKQLAHFRKRLVIHRRAGAEAMVVTADSAAQA